MTTTEQLKRREQILGWVFLAIMLLPFFIL